MVPEVEDIILNKEEKYTLSKQGRKEKCTLSKEEK